jgi:hypothetical protein
MNNINFGEVTVETNETLYAFNGNGELMFVIVPDGSDEEIGGAPHMCNGEAVCCQSFDEDGYEYEGEREQIVIDSPLLSVQSIFSYEEIACITMMQKITEIIQEFQDVTADEFEFVKSAFVDVQTVLNNSAMRRQYPFVAR